MIIKVGLVIPVYNSSQLAEPVVEGCLREYPYTVFLVDDGSMTPFSDSLSSDYVKEQLECGRLKIIRHSQNRGKGAALKTAFQKLTALGFTHAICLDGDGQHKTKDIQKFVAKIKESPWDIIIGARRFGENVPGVSQFGRKFSNFWVKYQTGQVISDSQSGFRAYPLFHIQNLNLVTNKYDFEIEVLVKALWKNIAISEIEVDVYYPSKDHRVSHFNKFSDNVRISLLNILLVVFSLLKLHTSPKKGAMAFATGIFIGSTPLFGLHSLLAATASFLGRLNFGIMFLGTQISIPPLLPLTIGSSVILGSWLLEQNVPDLSQISFDTVPFGTALAVYIIGSLAFGAIASIVGFFMWWFVAHGFQKKTKQNWTGKMRGGRGNHFLFAVIKNLGLKWGYFCLLFVIPYFYLFAPTARRGLNEYWKINAPQMGWWQRQLRVLKHLFVFAQTLMDRAYQGFSKNISFKIISDGFPHIRQMLDSSTSGLLFTAHMGSWDLAATSFDGHKINNKIHILEYYANKVNPESVMPYQRRDNINKVMVNPKDQTMLKILDLLNNNYLLAMMGDRPLDKNYELVPLMGRLAPIPSTGYRLAMTCKCPIVYTFGFKGDEKNYHLYAEEIKTYEAHSASEKILKSRDAAMEYAQILEKYMKRYPYQWFNLYPFWSSLPTLPGTGTCKPNRYYLEEELRTPKVQRPVSAPVQVPSVATELQ